MHALIPGAPGRWKLESGELGDTDLSCPRVTSAAHSPPSDLLSPLRLGARSATGPGLLRSVRHRCSPSILLRLGWISTSGEVPGESAQRGPEGKFLHQAHWTVRGGLSAQCRPARKSQSVPKVSGIPNGNGACRSFQSSLGPQMNLQLQTSSGESAPSAGFSPERHSEQRLLTGSIPTVPSALTGARC
ncbi:unnamed protein product [Pleuronectes platessa]|uniref:Uncharacterized protein n=1 Tax=Pleuronectes platessa TaxID=8262 RepID=A0A9N7VYQ4_PLEPL|nr:unnamed protein product [Pleuronectes platessa]